MKKDSPLKRRIFIGLSLLVLSSLGIRAEAYIEGLTGTSFNLTAKRDYISTAEGNSLLIWGYANGNNRAQYPGPTLIVNQGDTVTVTLTNALSVSTSMVFPGHQATASGGIKGLLTREAPPDGTTQVTYTFKATHPGTYTYYSGTNPDLQVEMGLFGAIIVRPTGFDLNNAAKRTAYEHPDTAFAREYLFLLSEMDPKIHEQVAAGNLAQVDTTTWWPVYWFINGRTGMDTLEQAGMGTPSLPTQPYNCLPRMKPGEKILLRVVGGGRDLHPLHTHGNHVRLIARDGRLLESAPGKGPDLSVLQFTITSAPGQTVDGLYQWTGEKLGWDIYGATPHTCDNPTGFDTTTYEYCPDHGKSLPVATLNLEEFFAGPFFSGTPFMGSGITLPPGEGGFNPTFGYLYMWHSHNEDEIVNFNIFPGGMLTMAIVEPPNVTLTPFD
jgi:manganese oxidase